jgi:hypothetical protein
MNLNNIKPESAYRIKYGGTNFVIVDQIYIYNDNSKKSFVLQNNKFRKRLYSENELKDILSEKEGFYDWQENKEMVLKIVCCKYRVKADYVIFNAADSLSGTLLTKKEILGDDINSEMYNCTPWAVTSLYFEK